MSEIVEKQNVNLNKMVSMNEIIDQLLPNTNKGLQQKLRIKIYNFARMRKQLSITIGRRKYFNQTVAEVIIKNVQDYANELKAEDSNSRNPRTYRDNKHSFEIRKVSKRNIRFNNQHNRRYNDQNNKYRFEETARLHERFNAILGNYKRLEQRYEVLQDKYNQALDEKMRLIEEQSKDTKALKKLLIEVLQKI